MAAHVSIATKSSYSVNAGSHLKEEDAFIHLLRELIVYGARGDRDVLECMQECLGSRTDSSLSISDTFRVAEALLSEHMRKPAASRLLRLCPGMSPVHVPLDLLRALHQYDARTHITARRFVPPSFKEIRRMLNLSVVHALAATVRLVTLDADETLYSDGGTLTVDSPMIPLIVKLLRLGVHVAIVTAAGYPGEPHKFEMRLTGLLRAFASAIEIGGATPESLLSRFCVVGGECNYLLTAGVDIPADGIGPRVFLREIPDELWKDGRGVRWDHARVADLLDTAQAALTRTAERLALNVKIIRKERAVGLIIDPALATEGARLTYETLEEVALSVQEALGSFVVPHTCFNGGNDVWVDVGNKALGIRAIQARIGAKPTETVHCGDRFTRTGNDYRAREVASALWVESPAETEALLSLLINEIRAFRSGAATGATPPTVSADTSPMAMDTTHPLHTRLRTPLINPATGSVIPELTLDIPFESRVSDLDSPVGGDDARTPARGGAAHTRLEPHTPILMHSHSSASTSPVAHAQHGGHRVAARGGGGHSHVVQLEPSLLLASQRSRLEGSGGRIVAEVRAHAGGAHRGSMTSSTGAAPVAANLAPGAPATVPNDA